MNKCCVLLVGGTGFIGRALAQKLADEGYEVHVLGRSEVYGLPDSVRIHQGSQDDPAVIEPLLAGANHVFHLAASTVPADTVWHPSREAELNILPGLRFLECAQRYPKNRYFFVSTGGALYGNCPIASESTLPQPSSYYGAAKLALEGFWGVFAQRHPGRVTILRPSNIYGPRQPLRTGFGVIRTLLERARDGKDLIVYGDGSAVRDYLYIDDMVNACVAAIDAPAITCNVGCGRGVTLKDLIAVVERVSEKQLDINYQPARASDAQCIVLDSQLAYDHLDWIPIVSLEEGITRTWLSL